MVLDYKFVRGEILLIVLLGLDHDVGNLLILPAGISEVEDSNFAR